MAAVNEVAVNEPTILKFNTDDIITYTEFKRLIEQSPHKIRVFNRYYRQDVDQIKKLI